MSQVLQNNVQNANLTTDLSSITTASTNLQAGVNALTQVQNLLTSVQSLALQANNATTTSSTDTTLAAQVNSTITQLVQLANQQLPNGQYLFGGTSSENPPFNVTSSDATGQPASVDYQGNQQDSNVIVSQNMTVNTLIPGSEVFESQDRGAAVYSGSTGAAAGSGTDSATGQGMLLVQHTLTTFDGTSGVTAGISSASGDTIIGPDGTNTLKIDDTSGNGTSGTVSLNGGPAVAFTNNDTNLKVTGSNGDVVYLNTTAITPGFSGSVSLTATGTLSVDGGTTTVPINFTGDQTVTNGATGAVTNVNSTNIRQAGTDQVDYQGTSSLFQTLINLRNTIANTQGLSATDRTAALGQQIAELDRATTNVANVMGTQSAQAQALTNLQTNLTQVQTNVEQSTSNLQDTNMATAVVNLQQQMNVYQASLQVAAQVNQLSLGNYLSTTAG
jgi:flagellar hook-associated protein 3